MKFIKGQEYSWSSLNSCFRLFDNAETIVNMENVLQIYIMKEPIKIQLTDGSIVDMQHVNVIFENTNTNLVVSIETYDKLNRLGENNNQTEYTNQCKHVYADNRCIYCGEEENG